MGLEFTSVPRPAADPLPPARAREIVAMSFTPAGTSRARAWLRRPSPDIPHRHISADRVSPNALDDVRDLVRNARVGARFVFSGPQADIYAARAQALREGAVEEEITLLETDATSRRVYCAHCKTTTPTRHPVGETVTCSGCSRSLVIYHHFSRRTASYLGYKSNAEEVP